MSSTKPHAAATVPASTIVKRPRIRVERVASPDPAKKDSFPIHKAKKCCLSPNVYASPTSAAKKPLSYSSRPVFLKTCVISKKTAAGGNKHSAIPVFVLTDEKVVPPAATAKVKASGSGSNSNKARHRKTESTDGYAARAKKLKHTENVAVTARTSPKHPRGDSDKDEDDIDDKRECAANSVRESLKLTSITEIKEMQKDFGIMQTFDNASSIEGRKRCSSLIQHNATVDFVNPKHKRRVSYFRCQKETVTEM